MPLAPNLFTYFCAEFRRVDVELRLCAAPRLRCHALRRRAPRGSRTEAFIYIYIYIVLRAAFISAFVQRPDWLEPGSRRAAVRSYARFAYNILI
jgi:hypothetical protein